MDSTVFTAVNKLLKIGREHKQLIESRVAEIGMHRTQHRILMYLARKGNLPSQKELAEYLEITPAAISGALQKLEGDGYIERKLGSDNRFNEITITDSGITAVEKTRKMFAEVDDGLFDGFTNDELADFSAYLDRILKNLDRENQ